MGWPPHGPVIKNSERYKVDVHTWRGRNYEHIFSCHELRDDTETVCDWFRIVSMPFAYYYCVCRITSRGVKQLANRMHIKMIRRDLPNVKTSLQNKSPPFRIQSHYKFNFRIPQNTIVFAYCAKTVIFTHLKCPRSPGTCVSKCRRDINADFTFVQPLSSARSKSFPAFFPLPRNHADNCLLKSPDFGTLKMSKNNRLR